MKNADVVRLPIAQIRLDGGTQPRTALDFAAIDDYAEAMAAGGKFPPVVVFHDGEHYWLADGFHRLKAAFAAGFDAIDCELRQGTLEDAQWYSFSANKTNGLRRTNEDKQRAVKSALLHARAASMSNYAIARHVGVDEATVRNWRSKLAASTEIPQIDTRTVSRQGTTYQQRTTQIGRRRVAKISAPQAEPAELAQVPPYLDKLLRAPPHLQIAKPAPPASRVKSLPGLTGPRSLPEWRKLMSSLPSASLKSGACTWPAGTPSPRRTRMMVTPELAKQWLESNTHNRPLSDELVIAYMVDMLDGRWQYNGDAIRFDHTGRLIDGQHRLHACVEAGVPFETDVVTGLAPDAIRTIDIGRVRTAGHIAHLEGVENASVACAIAGLAVLHRKYGIERMNDPRYKPTKTEIVEAARTLAGLDAAIVRARALGYKIAPPRVVGFCFWAFAELDRKLAERFFDELAHGLNLSQDNPVYHLRERLLSNRRVQGQATAARAGGAVLQSMACLPRGPPVAPAVLEDRWAFPREVPQYRGGSPMTADVVTARLAERVMGWSVAPDRYLIGNRSWIPRWRFQPLERLEDAFRLLEKAQPEYCSMGAGADGAFSVQVRIRGCGGEARHQSKPRAITLAIARALGLEVDE